MNRKTIATASSLIALLGLPGCGDEDAEGSGTLSVLLEAEDSITGGLDPGDDVENVRDGWQVRYDAFDAAIGDIDVRFSTDPDLRARDEAVFVVDLASVPPSGLPLWEISGLRAGRWDFNY